MHKEKIKRYLKLFSKVILVFFVYVFFLIYTPTLYGISKTFAVNFIEGNRIMIVGDTAIKVKVVDDEDGRQIGLSQTKKLEPNEGMFFIFEKEDRHGIWMKDMSFPIDIVWFNVYGSITHIEENVSPDSYPEVFKPEKNALYVLELNAGFVERKGLKMGDTIDLY